jgi:hypothetical protein
MAKFEYSIRSKDETTQGVKSAQSNLDSLEGSVKRVSKTMQLLMGGAAIGGITAALRAIARAAGESEKAFAAMHPETQKAAGSLTDWNNAMRDMRVAAGGIVASVLTPIRAAILNIIDPAHEAKAALQGVLDQLDAISKKYVSTGTQKAQELRDAAEQYQFAIKEMASLTAEKGETQRMLTSLGARPDIAVLANRYIEKMGMDASSALMKAEMEIAQWDSQVTYLRERLDKLSDGIADAAEKIAEYPKWLAEQNKNNPSPKPPAAPIIIGPLKQLMYQGAGVRGGELRAELHDVIDDVGEVLSETITEFPWHGAPGMAGPGEIMGQQLGTAQSGTGTTMPPWLVPIVEAFDSLVGFLGPLGSQFASLSMILNPLQTIMQAFYQAIAPVVNELLAPLVGILQIIGQTMAAILMPALRILSPVIEFLGKAFVFLYNMAIVPFGNALIAVFNILKALGQTIYYIVTFQWGKLGSVRWDPTAGALERIEYDTLGSAGAAAINEQSSESATYSTGRDITVNVIVNTEVITGENGGLRELALIIQREISNAVALGVA